MCGRFTRKYTWKDVHDFLNLEFPDVDPLPPSYNIAPTQSAPVCRIQDEGRALVWMNWGLIPRWSKDGKPGPINARSETAATNGMFRDAYKKRRCIVPASGFYEWTGEKPNRRPHYITPINDPLFALAGLWECWVGPDGPRETFTILTTEPNELMAKIHDRMPVILAHEDIDRWLTGDDPSNLLRPCPADEMEAFPVSTRVNSPKTDEASLIEPEERTATDETGER